MIKQETKESCMQLVALEFKKFTQRHAPLMAYIDKKNYDSSVVFWVLVYGQILFTYSWRNENGISMYFWTIMVIHLFLQE